MRYTSARLWCGPFTARWVQDRECSKKAPPANAGKSWSRAEDQRVSEEPRRGIDFHQIAKTHNRTIGSIIARLLKLGKIGPHTPPDMFDPKGGIAPLFCQFRVSDL